MPQYEFNLRDYWQIVRRRKRIILLTFFGIIIFTILFTNIQAPVYMATASVRVLERKPLVTLLTEMVTLTPADPVASQAKVIKSKPIIERVVRELDIVGRNATPDQVARAVIRLQNSVETEVVEYTNVIEIMVRSDSATRARDIANKIAQVYIDENLKEKNKQAIVLREFVETQLREVEVKLKKSEDILRKFKEKETPVGEGAQLQTKLVDMIATRTELLKKYTEQHPEIIRLNEQIETISERLKQLPEKELEFVRLVREVEINEKAYGILKERFDEARISEAAKVGDVSIVNPAIAPGVCIYPNVALNLLMGIMVGIMLGLTSGFVVENLDTSIGTIEDVESYLKLPVLGVIPYLEVHEEKVPWLKRVLPHKMTFKENLDRLRAQLLVHYDPKSAIAESYRILQTNIKIEALKGELKGKSLLVSSAGVQEGKSITAANLAIAMAQMGVRTLLVDGDLRRSIVHRVFGLRKEPGLTDVLIGRATLEEATRTLTDILMGEVGFDEALKVPGLDNLNIITAGFDVANPAETLGAGEMITLLEGLKTRFDVVIFDTPPVLAVTDASLIAPRVDGVLLVYKVGKTSRNAIMRTKVQLNSVNAQIKGIILNNITPEVSMMSGYYYHYYGKYYAGKKGESV